jgi:hypothetical protein
LHDVAQARGASDNRPERHGRSAFLEEVLTGSIDRANRLLYVVACDEHDISQVVIRVREPLNSCE